MSSYRQQHLLHKIFLYFRIIIQKQYIWCFCCFYSLIDSPADPKLSGSSIICTHDNLHLQTNSFRLRIRYPPGSLQNFQCLPFQTSQNAVQKCDSIKIRYDHRYFHIISYLFLSLLTPFLSMDEENNSILKEKGSYYSTDLLFSEYRSSDTGYTRFLPETPYLLLAVFCTSCF